MSKQLEQEYLIPLYNTYAAAPVDARDAFKASLAWVAEEVQYVAIIMKERKWYDAPHRTPGTCTLFRHAPHPPTVMESSFGEGLSPPSYASWAVMMAYARIICSNSKVAWGIDTPSSVPHPGGYYIDYITLQKHSARRALDLWEDVDEWRKVVGEWETWALATLKLIKDSLPVL